MPFDKNAYQREYMAKKRAQQPTSKAARMTAALSRIAELTADKQGPIMSEIRRLAQEATA